MSIEFRLSILALMEPAEQIPEYLKQIKLVAFDTETTGLWAATNRIVEIAAVKFSFGNEQTEVFQSLVNPQRPMPADVIDVHGITDEMVKDAPTIEPILEEFMRFVGEDSILVAHNAPFDISFVGAELQRTGLTFGSNMILDTVDIYRRYFPGLPSYSLLGLVRHFGLAQTQQHRALADAEFVRQLVLNAVGKFSEVGNVDEISKLFSVYRMADFEAQTTELPDEFADLTVAIIEGKRVEIEYQHPARGLDTRIIRPQRAFRLGSVYYVGAHCERARAERTFRLDRIANYRVLGDDYPKDQ